MINNFLITRDGILLLSEQISVVDYFISSEDLDDLINKKIDVNEFLAGLGRDSVIVRPIGSLDKDVYKLNVAEVIKVGEKKW